MTRLQTLLLILIILAFSTLSAASALRESLTYDEAIHLQEGVNGLVSHQYGLDNFNPPFVREIAAIPVALGIDRLISSPVPAHRIFPSRMMIVLLTVVLLLAVFFTVRRYAGVQAGILATFLLAFEPSVLAHSHYVAMDMGFTLFFFLAYIALLHFFQTPSVKYALLVGLGWGAALASKVSGATFFVGSAFLLLTLNGRQGVWRQLWQKKFLLLLITMVASFFVWATYFFSLDYVIRPDPNTDRVSVHLRAWARERNIRPIEWLLDIGEKRKIPLGKYLEITKNTAIYSRQPKPIFFFGTLYNASQWYFFPVILLLKVSLALLTLFFFSFLASLRDKKLRATILLFLPPIVAIMFIAMVSRLSPWIRYTLAIYPFLAIVAGMSVQAMSTKLQKTAFIVLCVLYVLPVLTQFPHYQSYYNDLVARRERFAVSYDTNIDWGEKLITIKQYMDATKPSALRLSYFGTDNGALYGLPSSLSYEPYSVLGTCAFHEIAGKNARGPAVTMISVSNWYYCEYNKDPRYKKEKIQEVVSDALLVFRSE